MQTVDQEQRYDDEIDLRDLVRTLVKRKKIIFLVAFVTLMGALTYALLATPIYKATATFLPPTEADISHLVIPDIYTPNQEQLYQSFAIALESRKVYWETFNSLSLLEYLRDNNNESTDIEKAKIKTDTFDRFAKNITMERATSKKGEVYTPNVFLSVQDKSPEMAAKITNNIAEMANKFLAKDIIKDANERITLAKIELEKDIADLRSIVEKQKMDEIEKIKEQDHLQVKEISDKINELKKTYKKKIADQIEQLREADNLKKKEITDKIDEQRNITKKNRLDKIEQLKESDRLATQQILEQIEILKNNAATIRDDRIKTLEEAASIAKASGITERSNTLSSQPNQDKSAIYAEINTQAQPLYLRGEKELRAEVNELKARKYDDPFIPSLRELQQKLAALKENKEIEILAARKNDDPFIPELRALQEQLESLKFNRQIEILLARKNTDAFIPSLRELQEQLELLKNNRKIEVLLARESNDPFTASLREKELRFEELSNIQLEAGKVRLATFDQPAYPPVNREKPKRSLIVALGAVLGLFLGIMAAFLLNFWEGIREEDRQLTKRT